MKNALILLLLGGILGAVALHLYDQREAEQRAARSQSTESEPTPQNSPADNPPAESKGTIDSIKEAIANKLVEWHLTADDIKNDLAKTGQVVRTKTQAVGEKISDGRIIAVIKAKYVLDRDLSARDISVGSHDGEVDLGGTVASPELIGKAVALALDTDGVHGVTSKISVEAK
jgi:gas vesicle protein